MTTDIYTEDQKFYWRLTAESAPSLGTPHFRVMIHPVKRETYSTGKTEYHKTRQYPRMTQPGHYYDGLTIRAFAYKSEHAAHIELVGWSFCFDPDNMSYDSDGITIEKAQQIIKTLTRIDRAYNKIVDKYGDPKTFGQFIRYKTQAIGPDCLGFYCQFDDAVWGIDALLAKINQAYTKWLKTNFDETTQITAKMA